MKTFSYMNHLYAFVPLNSQTAHVNEISECILFARYGFKNQKSRKDLSLVGSKYGSCYQTLCDLSMTKHFMLSISMFRDVISINYVITSP